LSFITTIQGIRSGQLAVMLDEDLQDVITSVIEHSKPGALTLKLKIVPNGERQITITSEVVAKQARAGVSPAIFFADTGGTLHRTDPRQGDLLDPSARQKKEQN
jgi:hypothetical protein